MWQVASDHSRLAIALCDGATIRSCSGGKSGSPMMGVAARAVFAAGRMSSGSSSFKKTEAYVEPTLEELQHEAREDREREVRVASEHLTFAELYFEREREQAREALSNMETLKRDVKKVRARIRRGKRCLLDPNGSLLQVMMSP